MRTYKKHSLQELTNLGKLFFGTSKVGHRERRLVDDPSFVFVNGNMTGVGCGTL